MYRIKYINKFGYPTEVYSKILKENGVYLVRPNGPTKKITIPKENFIESEELEEVEPINPEL